MTNTNEFPLWLADGVGLVDPRGWTDVMQEVATQYPEIAEDIRNREMADVIEGATRD